VMAFVGQSTIVGASLGFPARPSDIQTIREILRRGMCAYMFATK